MKQTHSEHKFSDIDGLQLVADVHSAFDELDAMLNSERDSAVSAVREAFESKYKSKLNGDPTMSSTVIPNINGYQL